MNDFSIHTIENSWIETPTGDKFPFGDKLGSGSWGTVYASGDDKIIKIINDTGVKQDLDNLHIEATIQKKLSEKVPGTVPVLYDFGRIRSKRQLAIVMEKCEDTARNLFKTKNNPEDFLDYYEQIADILARLEKYNFNHRDLKSDNVMYKTDPTTGKKKFLLIDFGFACGTFDGVRYAGTSYFKPEDKCFRRSRDLAQLVFESLYYTKGDIRTFAQLVLTFMVQGIQCDMSKGCAPYFSGKWLDTYKFLKNKHVENPNTTPEGLKKAVASYRQGGLESCRAGFVVHPVEEVCVPVPPPPAPDALKTAVTPVPHMANPAAKPVESAKTKKKCPPGKVLNPKTRRCIKEKKPKECPPGKVINPATGRCINEKK